MAARPDEIGINAVLRVSAQVDECIRSADHDQLKINVIVPPSNSLRRRDFMRLWTIYANAGWQVEGDYDVASPWLTLQAMDKFDGGTRKVCVLLDRVLDDYGIKRGNQ